MSLNLELKAKQDIKMPGTRGRVIPKGTPFIWNPRVKQYIAHIDGEIVSQVSADYVDRVNIFEI